MASLLDACIFYPSAGGTVDFEVSSPKPGWRTPADAGAVNGATYRYRAFSADQTEWEVGTGVYTSGTTTLSRAVILDSSNSGAKTDFTVPPSVAVTILAADFATPAQLAKVDFLTITQAVDLDTLESDVAAIPSTYVAKAGSTMTGDLTIAKANPGLAVDKTASGQSATIMGKTGGLDRWSITLGNLTAESGSAEGSDFSLDAYNDDGSWRATVLTIDRSNSGFTMYGDVTTTKANPYFGFNKQSSGEVVTVAGWNNWVNRWGVYLGDSTAEAGSNSGSDFGIAGFSDAGSWLGLWLAITRSNGAVTLGGNSIVPAANDGMPLGSASKSFSDLFLASGGVINFNNGDVTATHAVNSLAFGGASSGYTFDAAVKPSANDAAALGASGTAWSDLFLASGGVINFAAGNATLTHSTGLLTSNVAFSVGTSLAITAGTIELGAASDTTLSRVAAGRIAVEGSELAKLASPTFTGTPAAPTAAAGTSTTQLATTAFVDDALEKLRGYDPQTGTTYTFVLADAGKLVSGNNASAQTFTVPPNSTAAFDLNTVINLVQLGAGQISIAAGAGVTIRSSGSKLKLTGQYSAASLIKIATDEWVLFGDLAS